MTIISKLMIYPEVLERIKENIHLNINNTYAIENSSDEINHLYEASNQMFYVVVNS